MTTITELESKIQKIRSELSAFEYQIDPGTGKAEPKKDFGNFPWVSTLILLPLGLLLNSVEGWFFQFIAGLFLVVAFFSFSDFFEKIRFKRRTAPHLLRIRELELEFREVVNQLYGRWAGSLIEKELLESELIAAVAGKVDLFYASTVNNPSYINEKGILRSR